MRRLHPQVSVAAKRLGRVSALDRAYHTKRSNSRPVLTIKRCRLRSRPSRTVAAKYVGTTILRDRLDALITELRDLVAQSLT
jgi:hypothetical protein